MRVTLAPHIEAMVEQLATQLGQTAQEWVRSLIARELFGGDTRVAPTDTKVAPTDTKVAPVDQSSSSLNQEGQEVGGGDTKVAPTDTKVAPTDTDMELAGWKPSPGDRVMPYEAFKAAVKVLFHNAEVDAPRVQQLNAWAKALCPVAGERGRWQLVKLLTEISNRGSLGLGEAYLWGAVRRLAAEIDAEDRGLVTTERGYDAEVRVQ